MSRARHIYIKYYIYIYDALDNWYGFFYISPTWDWLHHFSQFLFMRSLKKKCFLCKIVSWHVNTFWIYWPIVRGGNPLVTSGFLYQRTNIAGLFVSLSLAWTNYWWSLSMPKTIYISSITNILILLWFIFVLDDFGIQPWWSNMCFQFLPSELFLLLTDLIIQADRWFGLNLS